MTTLSNPWTKTAPPRGGSRDPLANDIAAVLKRMGGSAHQSVVIDCVVAIRRQNGETTARQDLVTQILEVLERYRDLFFRPFGEGSMRWALKPGAA
jgi:hypothetical protein